MGTEDIAGEEKDECREEDHRVAREDQQVAGQIVLGAIHTGRILKELRKEFFYLLRKGIYQTEGDQYLGDQFHEAVEEELDFRSVLLVDCA